MSNSPRDPTLAPRIVSGPFARRGGGSRLWWYAASVATLVALGFVGGAAPAPTSGATFAQSPLWQTTWTSPMDLANGVAWNATVRDVATVAEGGNAIEITLSNLWSNTPTRFNAATVGVSKSGVSEVPGTIVPVTFNGGSRSVVVAAHSRVTSDPIPIAVQPRETLAVSVWVAGPATVSVHYCCYGRIDSYTTADGSGNLTNSYTGYGFDPALTGPNMRWLSRIAVRGSPAQGTVVAFGDSITDGFGYLNNGFSWVNALQARIDQLAPSNQVSVVNEGIAGNTLTVFPPRTSYEDISGGLPGVSRIGPDALSLAGVRDVILFLGTNDIWFGAGGEAGHPIPPYGTAPALEAAMRQIISVTHAHGLKIFAVTLLPRSSSAASGGERAELWDPAEQAVLSAVNTWMLSPGAGFDGVINAAAVMGDVYDGACQPNVPFAPYFNSDHLHPNVVGQTVLANTISTAAFGLPQAPLLPAPLAVTPTANCPAATVAEGVLAQARVPGTTTTTTSTTTTTQPPTTTTQPAGLFTGIHQSDFVLGAILVIAAGLIAAIWRRRAVRRRAARRRNQRRIGSYGYPKSPRSGPPSSRPPQPR